LGDLYIDDLWIDYFCVSTDLKNQCLRVHRRGSDSDDFLWRLVRASMTLCGVLPPIPDRDGNILVDGGYMNNIPVDVCLDEPFSANVVIAVDASSGSQLQECSIDGDTVSGFTVVAKHILGYPTAVPSFTQLQGEIVFLANSQQEKRFLGDPRVLLIKPPLKEYGLLEFGEYRDIIQVGYEYAQAVIAQWRLDGTIDQLIPPNVSSPFIGRKRRNSF
jgi:lysophospholipid hydrolase